MAPRVAPRPKKTSPKPRSGGTPLVERRDSIASGRTYRDLPIIGIPNWDSVGAVKQALSQLEQAGNFANASLLFDAMLADDRIYGVTSQRFDGLLGIPLDISPPEGLEEDARAIEIAEAAKVDLPKMASPGTLRSILRWGRGLGIGLAEKIWDLRGERWIPRLKVWHPRHMYWQWTDRLFHLTTEGGVIPLYAGPNVPDAEKDRSWLMYAPYGYGRDAWINSLLRPLAIPWLIRQWAYRDWARYSEVHGLPIRKGKVPMQAKEEDKERFLQELTTLASESTIRLPDGGEGNRFDLELVEAVANTWEGFDRLLGKVDASLAIAVLGQNLTTEVQGGSLAASKVHGRVRGDILASDGETLAEVLRDELLRDWTTHNFGDPELTPRVRWNTDPPEDRSANATTLKTFGEGLKVVRETQIPVDVAELCERFDMPLQDGAEIQDYEPPPPPAPFGAPAKPEAEEPEAEEKLSVSLSTKADRAAVAGQVYVDELADNGRDQAGRVLAPNVAELRRIIGEATSYEDLRQRLVLAYRDMDPSKLARLMERCLVLASLSGRHAVNEEA